LPRKSFERRYNLLRGCLILSTLSIALLVPHAFALPVQPNAGQRYTVCFSAVNPSGSDIKCTIITVEGACTPATADVDSNGKVDVFDIAIVAIHYGEPRTGPEAWNPLDTGSVGLDDLLCVALMYGEILPV
jgi:hypothetical protein